MSHIGGAYSDMTGVLMRRYRDVQGTGTQRKGPVEIQEKVAICMQGGNLRINPTCQHLDLGPLESNNCEKINFC